MLLHLNTDVQQTMHLNKDDVFESMIAFPDHSFPNNDPLLKSQRESFPFPEEAARILSDQRSQRYDEVDLDFEEVALRIREFASMMGLSSIHDEPPTAA